MDRALAAKDFTMRSSFKINLAQIKAARGLDPKMATKSNIPLFLLGSPIRILKIWYNKKGVEMAWVELLNSGKRIDCEFWQLD